VRKQQLSLEAKNISFWYNKDDIFIKNASFSLTKGKIIGVVGENGTGKTTLVKILLGILKPKSGSINTFNSSISYVPQNSLSLSQNISCSVQELIISAKTGQIVDAEISKVCKSLGLENKLNLNIKNLSGGERQRVMIARALYKNPDILVFDEPTSNLDKNYRKVFYEIIEEYKQNKTIIIISHDNGKISEISDEVICLQDNHNYSQNGKIIHIHHD